MIESFVDLTYRGLALGRRIKLTQVRPTTGYLELPMPMPVGTLIAINTDEGVQLEAVVTQIHEQVGGSDRVPGMTVKPTLAAETASSWWQARVALPEESDEKPTRDRPITVRPRTHTVPQPPPPADAVMPPLPEAKPLTKEVTETKELSVFVAEQPKPPEPQPLSKEVTETKELSVFVAEQAPPPPEPPKYEEPPPRPKLKEEDIKRTMVMNAVDQELLAKLTAGDGDVEHLTRNTGEHAVVDDGLRTTVMEVPDPSALGFEVSASGTWRAAEDSGEDASDDAGASGSDKPKQSGGGGKKRKKRR